MTEKTYFNMTNCDKIKLSDNGIFPETIPYGLFVYYDIQYVYLKLTAKL